MASPFCFDASVHGECTRTCHPGIFGVDETMLMRTLPELEVTQATNHLLGSYVIRRAEQADLPLLNEIELAAAQLLQGHAPDSVLSEATPFADFEIAQRVGHLWVAAINGQPVGFAHVKLLEPHAAHLDELDVHPRHGRQGLGRCLVLAACEWAAAAGKDAVTLSTFREPRWNMPFYASLGFKAIPKADLSDALARIVADETRRGLNPTRRVVMRRRASERAKHHEVESARGRGDEG
jgi:GNAT superfamily N-acetyltransferase